MRKIIAILIAMCLVLVLLGCAAPADADEDSGPVRIGDTPSGSTPAETTTPEDTGDGEVTSSQGSEISHEFFCKKEFPIVYEYEYPNGYVHGWWVETKTHMYSRVINESLGGIDAIAIYDKTKNETIRYSKTSEGCTEKVSDGESATNPYFLLEDAVFGANGEIPEDDYANLPFDTTDKTSYENYWAHMWGRGATIQQSSYDPSIKIDLETEYMIHGYPHYCKEQYGSKTCYNQEYCTEVRFEPQEFKILSTEVDMSVFDVFEECS